MKIKPGHYAHMLAAMRVAQAAQPTMTRAYYEAQRIGISDYAKRHRWDLMYAAKIGPWVCSNLYNYANDEHIDTALRAIVKELESCAAHTYTQRHYH